MGIGWHSVMRSAVRLLPARPARRATISGSPFLLVPLSSAARASGGKITQASAVASRWVAALSVTSTMRGKPPTKWVSWGVSAPVIQSTNHTERRSFIRQLRAS